MGKFRQVAVDFGPGLAVVVLLVANTVLAPHDAPPLFVYVLLIAASMSLALRRFFPVAVLIFTEVSTFTVYVIDRPDVAVALPVLCALYAMIRLGPRMVGIASAVVYLAGLIAVNVVVIPGHPSREDLQARFLLLGWFVAAVVLAEAARLRERRAAELARSHEETLRRRAGEERLRIARDLHDSLTHSISVIKVQAGVAIHLARKRGEEVPDSLVAIQDASRDAMRELRETLEALRGEPETSGLDRLDDLVERARSTGLPVEVHVSGHKRRLPQDIDRAAYRIVQEALTNVTRHAGAATAAVHLTYGRTGLIVRVDDDGQATPDLTPIPGVGLIGMRERITALGGTLSACPRPTGGFRVHAELPVA
ncbi:sensor histidine kinase [Actinocrispum sp. NPDC049592]|uniref:sensor histidine kinase n=1 Tax=Actinocrispum sp. NPDC049592 TaxID=3154835 RepID=UPI0034270805